MHRLTKTGRQVLKGRDVEVTTAMKFTSGAALSGERRNPSKVSQPPDRPLNYGAIGRRTCSVK